MKKLLAASLLLGASTLFLGGCDMAGHAHHTEMWANVKTAVATLQPTSGNTIKGVITFEQVADGVHVTGQVTGLAANSVHGIHIHEFGDASADNGSAAGGHYNPEGHPHGDPMDGPHHAGDLGNLNADGTGTAKIDETIKGISVAGMVNPIIGRGVVVHANKDDFTSPAAPATPGNSGARMAVGVIGIKKAP